MDLTQLLLRLFVKDYRNTEDPAVRTRYGKLAGIVGIVCNVLLSAGKLLAGTLSGAVSITADGLNNLSDAASSLVTLTCASMCTSTAYCTTFQLFAVSMSCER